MEYRSNEAVNVKVNVKGSQDARKEDRQYVEV